MEEWNKYKLAWEIYGALKMAGADIGNASVPIISDVLDGYIEDDGNLREAAPLLLKACEATLDFFENLDSDGETHEEVEYPRLLAQLRAAIAAAKGEA